MILVFFFGTNAFYRVPFSFKKTYVFQRIKNNGTKYKIAEIIFVFEF